MPTMRPTGLRGYQRGWLRADIVAGGTVAADLFRRVTRPHAAVLGFFDRLGPERFFLTLPTAVQAYRDWSAESQRPKENSA